MSAASLLIAELRSQGAQLDVDGDRLRCRAPAGAITPELQQRVAEQKPALLDELRRDADRLLDDTERPVAVLIHSERYGRVWLAPTDAAASELQRDLEAEGPEIPILTWAEALRSSVSSHFFRTTYDRLQNDKKDWGDRLTLS